MHAYDLTKKAYENNEIEKLLKGEGDYRIAISAPSDLVPTSWSTLMLDGILPYCAEKDSDKRVDQLLSSVSAMMDESTESLWMAYKVYWFLCYALRNRNDDLHFIGKFPMGKLKEKLNEKKDELIECKKWSGISHEDGLWGDIRYADDVLIRYGLSLFQPPKVDRGNR